MSSLVHLGQAAAHRAELEAPKELRAIHGTLIPAGEPSRPARAAADVMIRFPSTVHHSASMWTAWDLMQRARLRHLVVVDDHHRPVGVLDDRTIALEWPPGPLGPHRTPVHTLLRGRARPRVRSTDDMWTVALTMLGAEADAVPVVDRDGRLFGLITLWHFAEQAAAHQGDLMRVFAARSTGAVDAADTEPQRRLPGPRNRGGPCERGRRWIPTTRSRKEPM